MSAKKEKTLKLWNGRGYCCQTHNDPRWKTVGQNGNVHVFIAAHSMADAIRLVEAYTGYEHSSSIASEIRVYFGKNCWGTSMDGITPERGIWIKFHENEAPIKVI